MQIFEVFSALAEIRIPDIFFTVQDANIGPAQTPSIVSITVLML
jgi:hypothetical protein